MKKNEAPLPPLDLSMSSCFLKKLDVSTLDTCMIISQETPIMWLDHFHV